MHSNFQTHKHKEKQCHHGKYPIQKKITDITLTWGVSHNDLPEKTGMP